MLQFLLVIFFSHFSDEMTQDKNVNRDQQNFQFFIEKITIYKNY